MIGHTEDVRTATRARKEYMDVRERALLEAKAKLDLAELSVSEVLALAPTDAGLRRLLRDVRAQRDRVAAAGLDVKVGRVQLVDEVLSAGDRG